MGELQSPASTLAAAAAQDAHGAIDLGELYVSLGKRLEQIVRRDVRAPEPVVEDACQFAWSRLIHHSHRVRRETALPWLATTAVHQALKLIRRDGRELSLDEALEQAGEAAIGPLCAAPDEVLEQRERLASVSALSPRQQRLVWLHAFGLNYAEIALHEGYTRRTVERQLLRAKRTLREPDG